MHRIDGCIVALTGKILPECTLESWDDVSPCVKERPWRSPIEWVPKLTAALGARHGQEFDTAFLVASTEDISAKDRAEQKGGPWTW